VTPVDRYTCQEVFQRLNDYLDRELSAEEMALVRAHLDTCAQCASEYAFESSTLDELKAKLRRIDLPRSVLDKIQAILSNPPPKDT
jgi:anti-sigma factor (TIGR02949 family)